MTTDKIQGKKNYGEHSNKKAHFITALTGSAPQKMAKGLQRVLAH